MSVSGTVAVLDRSYRTAHPDALPTQLTAPFGDFISRFEGWLSLPFAQLIIIAAAVNLVLLGLVILKPRPGELPPSLTAQLS